MRILLVEDDDRLGGAIATALQRWGHEVTVVHDGREALSTLGDQRVDLVLTDWKLPNLSGTELVSELRGSERFHELPVVMMSGRIDKAELVGAIKAGINGFLRKPFTLDQLREKLEELKGKRSPSLEEQVQAVCKGHAAFDRNGAGPLVVFGEADNTAAALMRPHRNLTSQFLVRATSAIQQANAEHSGLDLGYVIDTNIRDVLNHLTRQETRDRVKLVLLSIECSGNRSLLSRLVEANRPGSSSVFFVCDDQRQIPDEMRTDLDQLGADVFERQYLTDDNLQQLVQGHVVDRVLGSGTVPTDDIQKRIEADLEGVNLPTLPEVYQRIMRLAVDAESDIKDWSEVISVDPMTSAVIVRHARSPAYSFQSDITDVGKAVTLLGKKTVRDLVANEAVRRAFGTLKDKGFSLKDFWCHNAGAGFAAALLSFPLEESGWTREQRRDFLAYELSDTAVETLKSIDLPARLEIDRSSEDPFVAGMVHDIGKAAMIQTYPGLFPRLLEELKGSAWSKPMIAAEREVANGVTHPQLGEALARKWGIGDRLAEVIRTHHQSHEKPELGFLIGIADIIAQSRFPFPGQAKFPVAAALKAGKLGQVADFLPDGFCEQTFVTLEEVADLARVIGPAVVRRTNAMWETIG